MESRGRPFRLALPVSRRPLLVHNHRRTPSNSSVASDRSHRSDVSSEEQFVLSPPRTPGNEGAPFGAPPLVGATKGVVSKGERNGGGKGM